MLDVLSVRITYFWESVSKQHLEHETSKLFAKSERNKKNVAGLQLPWQDGLLRVYSVEVETLILLILRLFFPRLCVCRQKQKQPKSLLCVLQNWSLELLWWKALNTLSAWAPQNGLLAGKTGESWVEVRDLLKDVGGVGSRQNRARKILSLKESFSWQEERFKDRTVAGGEITNLIFSWWDMFDCKPGNDNRFRVHRKKSDSHAC